MDATGELVSRTFFGLCNLEVESVSVLFERDGAFFGGFGVGVGIRIGVGVGVGICIIVGVGIGVGIGVSIGVGADVGASFGFCIGVDIVGGFGGFSVGILYQFKRRELVVETLVVQRSSEPISGKIADV